MLNLKISPEKAILLITERINDLQTIGEKQHGPDYYDVVGWLSKTYSVIDGIYGADNIHPEEIRIIGLPACSCNSEKVAQMLVEVYRSKLWEYINEIRLFMQTTDGSK